jgi:GrpB-like predicted nucleotidyltransferase (UPF0157 family)
MTSGDAPVDIIPYDPTWPVRFKEEEKALRRALAAWLVGPIEHIGSTAIPGLAAKAVIDIMASVDTLDASRPAIAPLADLGYCYFPYRADSEHWFCKPSPAYRTHHLHLVPLASPRWTEAIAFRDYLRSHPRIAAEYGDLKRRLAQDYRFDREAYTEAKGPFIARITGLASQEGQRPAEHISLIEPTTRLSDDFCAMADEFMAESDFRYAQAARNVGQFVERCAKNAAGTDLPPDRVPGSTYWLVRDGQIILGSSRLRHFLNAHLEQEGGHRLRGSPFATRQGIR